jgi:DNA-binding NarL/FixJ family response regulator
MDGAKILSEQERTVVALVAEGRTANHIAREMRLAPRIVKRHIEVSRSKLGVRNNAQLVAAAFTSELI